MRVIRRNGFPIPARMDAITLGTWIFIRTDTPYHLLKHELVHVAQFKKDWLMPIKYVLSKSHMYAYEIEAYKESIKYGMPVASAVHMIHNGYNLGYSKTEIEAALRE